MRPSLPWLLVVAVVLGGAVSLWPQLHLKGGFQFPIYYENDHQTGDVRTNRLRTLITGREARVGPNLTYLVTQMEIRAYSLDGSTNLIARAPECILDKNERTASSTNHLQLEAANGQLIVSGYGFLCHLTNFNMTISNGVETTVRPGLLKSARQARDFTAMERKGLPNPGTGSTNEGIHITADRLHLDSPSNVVIYAGHVQVTSEQVDLSCARLLIQRSTNGSVEHITAEDDVVITSKEGNGVARGQRAVYRVVEGEELLTLNGEPAQWNDGPRRGEARQFTFDMVRNRLRAEGRAFVEMPKASLNQTDWLGGPGSTNGLAKAGLTNSPLRFSAEVLTVQFPQAGQPGRSILGQTNVLIVNPSDESRASADEASYSETNGVIQLTGQAVYESKQRLIRAHSLFLDRTNQLFRATTEAYLRLPLTALNKQTSSLGLNESTLKTNQGAQLLEIFSDRFDYQSSLLHFYDGVRVNLLTNDVAMSRMTCDLLTIKASNRVEKIWAEGQVSFHQLPVTAPDRTIEKELHCEWLLVNVATNGNLDWIIAATNVVGQQTEIRFSQPEPVITTLRAQAVMATFFPSNTLNTIVAEHDVSIRQNLRMARGERAVYTTTNNIVELTGEPTAVDPQNNVTVTGAEVLIWDRNANRFLIRQMRAEGDRLPVKAGAVPVPGR